jgi:transposase
VLLPPEVVELVGSLKREIEALRAENAELRRRLGLDSSHSSKPPSSDGLAKKPRLLGSLRTRSGRPSGGQKGHSGETLRQVAEPDAVIDHQALACRHCCAELDAQSVIGAEKRQVFDLPERLIRVTEHRACVHRCPHCCGETRAAFPEGVAAPAQYGERFKAAAVYLNAQQLVPEDRVAQLLADLFGAAACAASVAAWVQAKARALDAIYRAIGARAGQESVRGLDETGLRVAGKTGWLHTTSTLAYTFYRAGEPRSAVPKDLQGGVVVHDHFLPYRGLENVEHAYCNAHLLRELNAVIDLDGEPWAEAMRKTLLDANDAVRQAKAAGLAALPETEIEAFEARYWAAIREGLAHHRNLPKLDPPTKSRGRRKNRPAQNLLERFKTYKYDTLRFLRDFAVPFTNNLAEQDLRMMKVKMKISGGFRTLQGAVDFARLRSVVSSARKQGLNILAALTTRPASLQAALKL